MKNIHDFYTLSNGVRIPCIAFGTYKAAQEDNVKTIQLAIEAGYRYFDTASFYDTERVLGEAIKQSGIPREEFLLYQKCGKRKWDMKIQKEFLSNLWNVFRWNI